MSIKQTIFEMKCEKAAELAKVDVYFFYGQRQDCNRVSEDDGALFVRCKGIKACFSVDPSQDDPAKQNENTIAVLTALGLEKHIDGVLVEERDEEEYCSECGRPLNDH